MGLSIFDTLSPPLNFGVRFIISNVDKPIVFLGVLKKENHFTSSGDRDALFPVSGSAQLVHRFGHFSVMDIVT
jgi:hypothetical protein